MKINWSNLIIYNISLIIGITLLDYAFPDLTTQRWLAMLMGISIISVSYDFLKDILK